MDLSILYDILSSMGAYFRPFHLENGELCCNPPLRDYPPPPTLHSYISAFGVDLNGREIQLAVHYGVGSLIGIK